MAGITIENPTSVTNPVLTLNGVSITINALSVDEEYSNPVFVFTPPTSTPKQASQTAQDAWIINLLRITRQVVIRGYIDDTDRASLRVMAITGDLKNNPLTLSWDGLDGGVMKGVLEKLTIHRPAEEEQTEWPVDITFTRGAVR